MIETQCRCGAIRLGLSGQPLFQLYCHCDDCRSAQGTDYRLSAIYRAEAVKIVEGEPATMAVKSLPRLHCSVCGTHMFVEVTNGLMRSVNGYLLPEGTFAPQFHVYCEDAVRPITDDLPHYKRLPALFGGTDELVGW